MCWCASLEAGRKGSVVVVLVVVGGVVVGDLAGMESFILG